MISVEERLLSDIPCILLRQDEDSQCAHHYMVVYHGWTQSKETALNLGYLFARAGFDVVIPDVPQHGQRQANAKVSETAFVDNIVQASHEFASLYKTLNLTEEDEISVCGWSMGGIISSMIMAYYPNVQSAGILMGSPKLYQFIQHIVEHLPNKEAFEPMIQSEQFKEWIKPFDLDQQQYALAERPVYLWHARNDSVVPSKFTEAFIDEHVNEVAQGQIVYQVDEEGGHRVPFAIYHQLVAFLKSQSNILTFSDQ